MMKDKLPAPFLEKMKILLEDEYAAFLSSYDAPRVCGLRLNPLKLGACEWLAMSPLGNVSRPIPWSTDGFYYPEEDRPGKHIHYNAGLYYIQEPSAMLPVELLDVQPGHRVLDLCAAPGGKSTQIGGKLLGQGVLVSNDNAFERTKALAKNMELAGVRNAVILNEEPSRLSPVFKGWFDRILVDAPCSGEGMFRKDVTMAAAWEKHSVERCTIMQRDILEHAASMLAPGGLLLYSTCTFSPEENESQIAAFLADNPDYEVQPIRHGLGPGRPEWIDDAIAGRAGAAIVDSLSGTARIWPHLMDGEGHYAALLRRCGSAEPQVLASGVTPRQAAGTREPSRTKPESVRKESHGRRLAGGGRIKGAEAQEHDPHDAWRKFCGEQLRVDEADAGLSVAYGERLYWQPTGMPSLEGLKVVRAGWYVGDSKRGRFSPSQALAMGLRRGETCRSISWPASDERLVRYLNGETIFVEELELDVQEGAPAKGYVLVCLDDYPLGWAKYADGMLKNELSTGWRRI